MLLIFPNLASFTVGGFYYVKDYFFINVFGSEVYVAIIGYINIFSAVFVIGLTLLVYHYKNIVLKMKMMCEK